MRILHSGQSGESSFLPNSPLSLFIKGPAGNVERATVSDKSAVPDPELRVGAERPTEGDGRFSRQANARPQRDAAAPLQVGKLLHVKARSDVRALAAEERLVPQEPPGPDPAL